MWRSHAGALIRGIVVCRRSLRAPVPGGYHATSRCTELDRHTEVTGGDVPVSIKPEHTTIASPVGGCNRHDTVAVGRHRVTSIDIIIARGYDDECTSIARSINRTLKGRTTRSRASKAH